MLFVVVVLISTMVAPFKVLVIMEDKASFGLISQVVTTGKFNSIKKVPPLSSSEVSKTLLAVRIPDLVTNSTLSESTKPFEKRQ